MVIARMMRVGLAAMVLLCIPGVLLAAEGPAVEYQISQGRKYRSVTVSISNKGEVAVTWEKYDNPKGTYATRLSEQEIAYLRTTTLATGFLDEARADDTPLPPDSGQGLLRVSMDGRERTAEIRERGPIAPLAQFLWKLITQGELLHELAAAGDVYEVLGGVAESPESPRVLQPQVFVPPLQQFVSTSTNRQKVEWALEALADITTPEVFAGTVSRAAEDDAQHRRLILSIVGTHPFSGNIPRKHLVALNPFCLAFLKQEIGRLGQMSSEEHNAVRNSIAILGYTRYTPAIPWLIGQITAGDAAYVSEPIAALAGMGDEGLRAAAGGLLSHQEQRIRLCGIKVLTFISAKGPKAGFADPLPAEEYQWVIRSFNQWALPQLECLAEKDPSAEVRDKSKAAIAEIRSQLVKHTGP